MTAPDEIVAVTVRVPERTRTAMRVIGGVLDQTQGQLLEAWADRAIADHGLGRVLDDAIRNQQQKEAT